MKRSILNFRCFVSNTNDSLAINFSKIVCHIFIKTKILQRIRINQTKEEKIIKHLITILENKHANSPRNETDQRVKHRFLSTPIIKEKYFLKTVLEKINYQFQQT